MKMNLVIQTAFLGDLILTIPFLQYLKSRDPKNSLALVCKEGLGTFLLELKIVDQVFEVKKGVQSTYDDIFEKLENHQVENLYCVHRSLRSQLLARKIKAEKKIGYKSWISFLIFDQGYRYPKTWPDVLRKFALFNDPAVQKELQKISSIESLNVSDESGRLSEIPEFFNFKPIADFQTTTKKKQVCLFPGSVWATKKWSEVGFIEVGQKLGAQGFEVHLMGSKDEKDQCDRMALKIPNSKVLAGSLPILGSIRHIAESQLVVANDSAATHMAALVSCPSITLFGPTVLKFGFRPWNNQAVVVENNKMTCRPCGAHGPNKCPLGHHRCMTEISSSEVLQKSQILLPQISQD